MVVFTLLGYLMGPAFLAAVPVSLYGVWRGRVGWVLAGAALSLPMSLYFTSTPRFGLIGLLPVACHLLAALAVRFRLRWAGAVAIAPVLVGIGYFNWELSLEGSAPIPPAPVVTAGGVGVSLYDPNHCAGGGCAYGMAPPALVRARRLEPELVPAGAEVAFTFAEKPLFYTVRRWEGNRPVELKLDRSGGFALPTAPGEYIYDVSARWRQGGTYWVFYVWVEP